jgi:type IV pilus assembly protein PilA
MRLSLESRRPNASDGFTVLELLLVVALIGTVSSIAVPGLMRAKMAANEASAIGSSRAVLEAQAAYSAVCGGSFYAESLAQLAADQYIGPDLVIGVKSGYNVSLTFAAASLAGPADCNGIPTTTDFYWSAIPVSPARTGTRSFAADAIGTIWQDGTGVVIVEPLGSGSETPIQ